MLDQAGDALKSSNHEKQSALKKARFLTRIFLNGNLSEMLQICTIKLAQKEPKKKEENFLREERIKRDKFGWYCIKRKEHYREFFVLLSKEATWDDALIEEKY